MTLDPIRLLRRRRMAAAERFVHSFLLEAVFVVALAGYGLWQADFAPVALRRLPATTVAAVAAVLCFYLARRSFVGREATVMLTEPELHGIALGPVDTTDLLRALARLRHGWALLGGTVTGFAIAWCVAATAQEMVLIAVSAGALGVSVECGRSRRDPGRMRMAVWAVASLALAGYGVVARYRMSSMSTWIVVSAALAAGACVAIRQQGRVIREGSLAGLDREARLLEVRRFAVAGQDVRTLIIANRRITGSHDEVRPNPFPAVSGITAALVRRHLGHWRSPRRLASVALWHGAATGLATGVGFGTGFLLAAVGLAACAWACGTRLVECLAQSMDKPTLTELLPAGRLRMLLIDVALTELTGLAVALPLSLTLLISGRSEVAAVALVLPVVLLPAAAIPVLLGPVDQSWMMIILLRAPELGALQVLYRALVGPAASAAAVALLVRPGYSGARPLMAASVAAAAVVATVGWLGVRARFGQ